MRNSRVREADRHYQTQPSGFRTDLLEALFEANGRKKRPTTQKSALKVPLSADFDEYDPDVFPSSRRRKYWSCSYTKLKKVLKSRVNSRRYRDDAWDTVQADLIRAVGRSNRGRAVARCLRELVDITPDVMDLRYQSRRETLYVDYSEQQFRQESGILKFRPGTRWVPPVEEVTAIDVPDEPLTKYELVTFNRPASCGCVHYHHFAKDRWGWLESTGKCWHGNVPVKEKIWFKVWYRKHDPEEAHHSYLDRFTNEIVEVHYKDLPERFNQPKQYRQQQANKKQLKEIHERLDNSPVQHMGNTKKERGRVGMRRVWQGVGVRVHMRHER